MFPAGRLSVLAERYPWDMAVPRSFESAVQHFVDRGAINPAGSLHSKVGGSLQQSEHVAESYSHAAPWALSVGSGTADVLARCP